MIFALLHRLHWTLSGLHSKEMKIYSICAILSWWVSIFGVPDITSWFSYLAFPWDAEVQIDEQRAEKPPCYFNFDQ